MDPMTFWTALGVLVVIFGGIAGVIRKGDRDTMDIKVGDLSDKLNEVSKQVTEKAHKDEIIRIEARFDKEFDSVRAEQRTGFAEMRQDLKDLRVDLMSAIGKIAK